MISSFTALLSKKIPDKSDPDAKEFMEFIIDAALRMQQLISGILFLSRVNTKGSEFISIKSESALQGSLKNLYTAIKARGVLITYDSLPEIFADPMQIEQLFQNLIGNAIKYSGDKIPEIHISCKQSDNEWIFSVKDNGIGINPAFHDRIFKIFQRLHTRNEYEGIGVGLAICTKIVQRHKGRIWVESEEGKGSEFFFSIPFPS
jgi:light-regulated signal transduction histidine kinase (bacteriophytochrome)